MRHAVPTAPSAATITVRETLALLDGRFATLAEAVAQGSYAFWLGSGVSRERVDDVSALILRILMYLHSRVNWHGDHCKFLTALEKLLKLAQLSPFERASLDLRLPVPRWPMISLIQQRLSSRYAQVLDIRVEEEEPDYLVWDALDVRGLYGDRAAAPDCEHLCIGVLALEGAIVDIVSSNWDGLIEAAGLELRGSTNTFIEVCVRAEDFRQLSLPTKLLKFHGCAIKANENEAVYRKLLIARQTQINDWVTKPAHALMLATLVQLATNNPTLMIGMSAQDGNVQQVFNRAKAMMPWNWPSDPPAYVFAEDALGIDQQTLLACVYRDAYDANPAAVEESARFPAYSKALLTALVLHVLCAKLCAFVDLVPAPHLDDASRSALAAGLVALRNLVASNAEPDRLAFIRNLVRHLSHGLALFHDGQPPAPGALDYRPVARRPIHQIAGDDMLRTSGRLELAVALALFGMGHQYRTWSVELDNVTEPNAGTLVIVAGTGRVRVFFVAASHVAVRLRRDGRIREDDPDAVVIHSADPVAPMPRKPTRAPGRTGRQRLRNVGMETLIRAASDHGGLLLRFREEAGL